MKNQQALLPWGMRYSWKDKEYYKGRGSVCWRYVKKFNEPLPENNITLMPVIMKMKDPEAFLQKCIDANKPASEMLQHLYPSHPDALY